MHREFREQAEEVEQKAQVVAGDDVPAEQV